MSIKKKLFSFLKVFFKEEFQEEYDSAYWTGRNAIVEAQNLDREQIRLFEVESRIGKPVIYVSAEWCNPLVGFGVGIQYIGETPLLMVKDYISGEVLTPMSAVHDFSQTLLDAVLKLTPFEAGSIIYKSLLWTHEHKKIGERDSFDEIMDKLNKSGFFEELSKQ